MERLSECCDLTNFRENREGRRTEGFFGLNTFPICRYGTYSLFIGCFVVFIGVIITVLAYTSPHRPRDLKSRSAMQIVGPALIGIGSSLCFVGPLYNYRDIKRCREMMERGYHKAAEGI